MKVTIKMNLASILCLFCLYNFDGLASQESKSDYSANYVSCKRVSSKKNDEKSSYRFFISDFNILEKNDIPQFKNSEKEYLTNWLHDTVLKNLYDNKEYNSVQKMLYYKGRGKGDCHHAAIISNIFIAQNLKLKEILKEQKIRIFSLGGTSEKIKENYIWPYKDEGENEQKKTAVEWEEKFKIQEKINNSISKKGIGRVLNFFKNLGSVPTEEISQEYLEEIGSVGEIKNKLIEIYCNLVDYRSIFIIAKSHKKEVEEMLLENTQRLLCAEKMKISELSTIFTEYEKFLNSIKYVGNKNELERTLEEIGRDKITPFNFTEPITFHSDIFVNLIDYFQKNGNYFLNKDNYFVIRFCYSKKCNKYSFIINKMPLIKKLFEKHNDSFINDHHIIIYDIFDFLTEEDVVFLILSGLIKKMSSECLKRDRNEREEALINKVIPGGMVQRGNDKKKILLINKLHKDKLEEAYKKYALEVENDYKWHNFYNLYYDKYIKDSIFYIDQSIYP